MMISVNNDTSIYSVQYVSAGIKIATFVSFLTNCFVIFNQILR